MSKAYSKMVGISPYKARLVATLVRGMSVADAEGTLSNMSSPVARHVLKLLRSAVANAEHNESLRRDNLRLASIRVDQGTRLKRYKPRARGRAGAFNHPTSHITVQLGEL